jgi:hypothetical protein
MVDTVPDSNTLKYAGDVDIADIRIAAANGTVIDVFNFVVELSLFEDIQSPSLSGELVINDAIDLTNLFPLIGEERIFISFKTPGFSEESRVVGSFYIYKMSERTNNSAKQTEYTLHFISIEGIRDQNIRYSRSYEGTPTAIAPLILQDERFLNTNKPLFIGQSKNSLKYVSNYWSPFQNMNFLASRAISTTGVSNFVFFESYKGFVFESIDAMLQKQAVARVYYSQKDREPTFQNGTKRDVRSQLDQILNVDIPVAYDYMERAANGMYRSKGIYHDIVSKRYETKILDYDQHFETLNHLNPVKIKTPVTPTRSTSRIELVNRAYENFLGMKSDRAKEWYQQRVMNMSQLFAQSMNIEIPGRTDLVCGAVLDITLYKNTPYSSKDDDDRIIDNVLSGRYLITKVRHYIDRRNAMHSCFIECVKDSFIKDVNDPKVTGYTKQ